MKILPQLTRKTILLFFYLLSVSLPLQALELIDEQGQLKSTITEDKLYGSQGQYQGMITPDNKMYDEQGKYNGQINNQTIMDEKGNAKAYIRDGKIYDPAGNYQGELKQK